MIAYCSELKGEILSCYCAKEEIICSSFKVIVSHFMNTMLGYVEIQSCFVTLNQENILLELYLYLGKYSKLLMNVDKNMRRGFF